LCYIEKVFRHHRKHHMIDFDYRVIYTEYGSYMQRVEIAKNNKEFWDDMRRLLAHAIALPLTAVSYLK